MEDKKKKKGKILPEPKPRSQRQNYTSMFISIALLILGIHGFITRDTIMIFGNQGEASHNYGFATAYAILGIFGIISATQDIKLFKQRLQADSDQEK
ncbi:MAG: hypothetical protein COA79_24985 [Planctomycetota bacterium]|nr:MAG: hypothetical protein COA79_24985 [Planctomycetota bacterium]